jgi:hypothetical protein
MKNYAADSTNIAHILTDVYFKGIYEGDVNLLGTVYYSGTLLFGDAAGKPFKGEIFSIEIIWLIVNKMISDVEQ